VADLNQKQILVRIFWIHQRPNALFAVILKVQLVSDVEQVSKGWLNGVVFFLQVNLSWHRCL